MIGAGTGENHHRVCNQLRLQQASRAPPDNAKKIEDRHEYQIEAHSKGIPIEQNSTTPRSCCRYLTVL